MDKETQKLFSKHIIENIPSKAWHVGTPGTNVFAFRVTWSPGSLSLTGDLYTLIVTHYSFNTWEQAAHWVNGASFDYFMEKTNATEIFDPVGTADYLIEYANENKEFWAKYSEHLHMIDEDKPKKRKEIEKRLRSWMEWADEHDVKEFIHQIRFDDYYGSYKWSDRAELQYEAFKFWAKLVLGTENNDISRTEASE